MIDLKVPEGERWLELGSGDRPHPSCQVHTDIRHGNGIDFVVDLDKEFTPQNEQAVGSDDFHGVLSIFAFEHVNWRNLRQCIGEVHRILKSGGKLVLVVPNTEAQLRYILSGRPRQHKDGEFTECSRILFGDNDYNGNSHKSFLSPTILTGLLQDAGFINIETTPFGELKTDMVVQAQRNDAPVKPMPTPPNGNVSVTPESPPQATFVHGTPPHGPGTAAFEEYKARQDADPASVFDMQYFDGGKFGGGYGGGGMSDFPCHQVSYQHVMARKPQSVIEVGAGRGYVLKRIQDAGIPAWGIDVSRHCYLTRVCDGLLCHNICVQPWPFSELMPQGDAVAMGDRAGGVKFDLCCRPDTLVHTRDGLRPISEIKVGDEVLTHRGRYREVTTVFRREYKGTLINLKPYCFGGLPVFVTPRHPVLAKKAKYREQRWSAHRYLLPPEDFVDACSLTTDDVLAFSFPTEIVDTEWIDMRSIPQPAKVEKEYALVCAEIADGNLGLTKIMRATGVSKGRVRSWLKGGPPKHHWRLVNGRWCTSAMDKTGVPVRTPVDDDFCRFVGYFLSDGYTGAGSKTIFVFSGDEDAFANDVVGIVSRLWGLPCRVDHRFNRISVFIESAALSRLISHFVTDKKTLQKCIPSWMLTLPRNKQEEILKGLIRGDGCSSEYGYTLATSSLPLLSSVQLLCLRLGIIPSMRVQAEAGTSVWREKITGESRVYNRARSFAIRISSATGLAGTFPTDPKVGNRAYQFGWIDGCTAFVPVNSLETIQYAGEVCNLEVAEDNSYVTSACAVHNCMSISTLEHIPEDKLPDVVKHMATISRRGLHGIYFTNNPNDPDGTKLTKRPREWWLSLFHENAPNYPVEILPKDDLENGSLDAKYLAGDGSEKWNLGCAQTQFHHGWINADVIDQSQYAAGHRYNFRRLDFRDGLPCNTGAVDLFYLGHTLEHVHYSDALKLLRECRRCIRLQGAMRLLVPNAELLMGLYRDGGLERFDDVNHGCREAKTAAGKLHSLMNVGHEAIYDQITLENILNEAGFVPHLAHFRWTGVPACERILKETLDTHPELSLIMDATPRVGI